MDDEEHDDHQPASKKRRRIRKVENVRRKDVTDPRASIAAMEDAIAWRKVNLSDEVVFAFQNEGFVGFEELHDYDLVFESTGKGGRVARIQSACKV